MTQPAKEPGKRERFLDALRSVIREAIASVEDVSDEFAVERAITQARLKMKITSGSDFDAWQQVVREELDRPEIPTQRHQSKKRPLVGQLALLYEDYDLDGGEK